MSLLGSSNFKHTGYGGDLKHQIVIFNSDNLALDITLQVVEFTIYESIFNRTMTIDVVVRDGQGIIDNTPLIGQELIQINYQGNISRTGPNSSLLFKIYQVSDRSKISSGSHVYVIKAASIELERDITQRVTNFYSGKTGSQIVEDVYGEYIENGTGKPLFIEDSDNIVTYTGSKQTPFEVIEDVAKESRSKVHNDSSHYLFYENRHGYNFRTISDLLTQPSIYDYYFSDPGQEVSQRVKNTTAGDHQIIGFTFLNTVDTIDLLVDGMYDSETSVIDPLTKTFREISTNYAKDYNTIPHITGGGRPVIRPDAFDGRLLGSNMEGPGHRRYIVDDLNTSINNQTFDNRLTDAADPHVYFSKERHKQLNKSIMQINSLKQHGIHITVPSNLAIAAGDIVSIYIPKIEELSVNGSNPYVEHYGNNPTFLVTSVSNKLSKNGDYLTTLECVKESFGKDMRGSPIEGLEGILSELGIESPYKFQSYIDKPFSCDRAIGFLTNNVLGFLQSTANQAIADLKNAAADSVEQSVDAAIEEATSDAVEEAAADVAEQTLEEAAVDIADQAVTDIENKIDETAAQFTQENIENFLIATGVTVATTQLLKATGISPAQFAKLITIAKLIQKLPLFTIPTSSDDFVGPPEPPGS
jgi:hypothetical protein